jgi:hypothetical protein
MCVCPKTWTREPAARSWRSRPSEPVDTSTYEPFDPEAVDASGEPREVVTTLEHHWDARLLQGFLEANGVSAWVATRGAVKSGLRSGARGFGR